MTSYNAINGTPSVADTYTANQLAQRTYGFNGYVTSDCGAIGTTYLNFPSGHDWAPTGWTTTTAGRHRHLDEHRHRHHRPAQAGGQAYALRAGTDLNCPGGENNLTNVEAAIKAGVLSEGVIDNALIKLFTVRMQTGEFDPPGSVPYTQITKSAIQNPAHQALATQVADNSVVLLKNQPVSGTSSAMLPLNAATTNKIVIVGDLAGTVTLGGYSGDPSLRVDAVQGITSAVQKANPNAQVVYDSCGTSTTKTTAAACSAQTLSDVKTADAVIVFVGTDENLAGEAKDRTSIAMPGNYDSLIQQINAVGNPRTMLAVQSDGPVSLGDVRGDFPTVVFSGYNGESQGTALADVLFGKQNPDGHLDFTWYADDSQLPAMSNYGLTSAETGGIGRTYQYFTGTPTYPFGYGLSYSQFSYSGVHAAPVANANGMVPVTFTVTNTGAVAGSTVAQLYASAQFTQSGVTFPKEQLVGFQKTNVLKPGQSQHITLLEPVSSLEIWDPNAMKDVVYDGGYAFNVGASSTDIRGTAAVKVIGSIAPQVQTVTVQPDQSSLQVGQTVDLTGKNQWIADDTTGVGSVSQGRNMSVTADNIVEAANNDGSFADLTKARVFYTSSDPRVATVDSKGLVTAVGDGAADITVTVNGVSGTAPIVVGHAVSVSAPALTQAGQASTVTTTFTNTAPTGGAAAHNVAMNLDLPSGWSATATTPATFASVPAGQKVTTTWSVTVPAGQAGIYTLDADATEGGAHDSTGYTQTSVPYASVAAAFNNDAITNDAIAAARTSTAPERASPQQALAASGVTPGTALVHDGLTFTWPNRQVGQPDNVVAAGQTIDMSGSGSTLGLPGHQRVGTGHGHAARSPTPTVSTQPFTIGFGDWANGTPPTGGDVAIRTAYGNQPGNATGVAGHDRLLPGHARPEQDREVDHAAAGQRARRRAAPRRCTSSRCRSSRTTCRSPRPRSIEPGASGHGHDDTGEPVLGADLSNVALCARACPAGWSATNTTPGHVRDGRGRRHRLHDVDGERPGRAAPGAGGDRRQRDASAARRPGSPARRRRCRTRR